MNKTDLIAQVSLEAGISKRAAAEAIDAIFGVLTRSVARGERVAIPGFGTFERRLRAPRTARNPRTGKKVSVPATHVPIFRAGQPFKDACKKKRR